MNRMTLRAYLEAGGRLDDLPLLKLLAESIVLERPEWKPERRAEAARSCRALAESLREPAHERLATVLAWAAEAYEDDEVAALFERALPEHVLGELLVSKECERSPHRLLVREVERYTCGACGERHKGEIGVLVGGTPVVYCAACIQLAAGAVHNTWAQASPGQVVGPAPDEPPPPRRVRATFVLALLITVVLAIGVLTGDRVGTVRMQNVYERCSNSAAAGAEAGSPCPGD